MAKVKKVDSKKLIESLEKIDGLGSQKLEGFDPQKLDMVQDKIFTDLSLYESIDLLEAMQSEEEMITKLSEDSFEMKNNISSTLSEIYYISVEKVDFETKEQIGANEIIKIKFDKELDSDAKKGFKVVPEVFKVSVKNDRNFEIEGYELLGDGDFDVSYNQATLKEIKQTVYYMKINKVKDVDTTEEQEIDSKILEKEKEDLKRIRKDNKKIEEEKRKEIEANLIKKVREVLRDLILYDKLEIDENEKSIQSLWSNDEDFLECRRKLISDIQNNEVIDLESVLSNFGVFFRINNLFSNNLVEKINMLRDLVGLNKIKLLELSEIEQAKLLIKSFKSIIEKNELEYDDKYMDIFIPQWHLYTNSSMNIETLSYNLFHAYLYYLVELEDDVLIKHFLLDKNLDRFFSVAHIYSYHQSILISKDDFEKCKDFYDVRYFVHVLNLYKIKDKKERRIK